jgi:hypothetical protein
MYSDYHYSNITSHNFLSKFWTVLNHKQYVACVYPVTRVSQAGDIPHAVSKFESDLKVWNGWRDGRSC